MSKWLLNYKVDGKEGEWSTLGPKAVYKYSTVFLFGLWDKTEDSIDDILIN